MYCAALLKLLIPGDMWQNERGTSFWSVSFHSTVLGGKHYFHVKPNVYTMVHMESFRDKTQDLTISYCYSQQIRAVPICHTPFSSLKVCFGGEVGAVLAWWHERWPGSPRDPILVLALLLLSRPCFKTVTSYSLC